MNRAAWIVASIIGIVAVGSAVLLITHEQRAASVPTPQDESAQGNAAVGANGASTIVTYADTGFSPTPQTISAGTTVTWENQSSRTMWIESADKRGAACDTSGLSLSACEGVGKGGTYSHTFTTRGTFSYVNHAQISDGGTIIVTDAAVSGPIRPTAIPQ